MRVHVAQVAKGIFFFLFFSIIPFTPESRRPSYLFFLLNLLILALAADSGILTSTSDPPLKKEKQFVVHPPVQVPSSALAREATPIEDKQLHGVKAEKVILEAPDMENNLNRSPSTPSIFFIAGPDEDKEVVEEEEDVEMEKVSDVDQDCSEVQMTKKELFATTERFIGNFYQRLKVQRQESWKKICGLYDKP